VLSFHLIVCIHITFLETLDYPINKLCSYSEEADRGIEDMVDLDVLNNATLLYNLKARYYAEPRQIYTYVTPSLLVVNPYQSVPHLMTEEIVKQCYDYIEDPKTKLKDVVPHTYSITARALKQMYENKERQAIVISGESGAGKTEAAKISMSLLSGMGKNIVSGKPGIEQRILACNPVLEAFGNAKTQRNYNSSRFGKYVKIIYDTDKRQVLGAITKQYLLEKSRIVRLVSVRVKVG
jgi:myosin heavy subunit